MWVIGEGTAACPAPARLNVNSVSCNRTDPECHGHAPPPRRVYKDTGNQRSEECRRRRQGTSEKEPPHSPPCPPSAVLGACHVLTSLQSLQSQDRDFDAESEETEGHGVKDLPTVPSLESGLGKGT